MKPVIPPAVSTPEEVQWVEGELIRNLMRTARNTQTAGLLLVPLFISVLWDDLPLAELALWAVLAIATALLRLGVIRKYMAETVNVSAPGQVAFFKRHSIVWPAS